VRVAVVANPVSSAEKAGEFRSRLLERGLDTLWWETTEADPGGLQAQEAVEARADVVVACGGDGTVRACAESLVDTNIPLAVLPSGTGNLLVRNLGLPEEPAAVVDLICTGENIRIDTGLASGETFVVMAGTGLDARIMDGTARGAKDLLGSAAYFLEGARQLFEEPLSAGIYIDDELYAETDWALILLGNLGHLQAGLEAFPDASPTDGVLDVLAIEAASNPQVLRAGFEALFGNSQHTSLYRATATRTVVKMDRDSTAQYQLDGEVRPPKPTLEFEVRPASLTVMIPKANE
jgi:diacylglycerol kinase (ATP)